MLLDQGGPQADYAKLQSLTDMLGGSRTNGSPNMGAMGPGDPSADSPRGWVNEAMDITGVQDRWADELYQLMMRESGGDPRAVNDTAVASGEHAKGLFQTIPSTFQAHNKPGLGGIFNPVANAVAAMRYIQERYGNPGNLPTSGGY